MPSDTDLDLGQLAVDRLRADGHAIAVDLQAEVDEHAAGRRKSSGGDPTRLVSLCCKLDQLKAAIRTAIELQPARKDLAELSHLVEGLLGPVMACAICELDPEGQILPERTASASESIQKLLEFTRARGTRAGATT